MVRYETKYSSLKAAFYLVLVLLSLFSGYGIFGESWWKFFPATLLLLLFTRVFYPGDWRNLLGLTGNGNLIGVGIALCLGMTVVSYFTINFTLPAEYQLQHIEFLAYLVPPLQSLNEEMVFRGLLLSGLLRLGWKKWAAILLPALIFSFLHWVFYYHVLSPTNQGAIDFSALLTLILFAIAMNMLFVKTGSIILPWAVHLGWNFTRFGGAIVYASNPKERISEFLTFNLIEGSNAVLLLSTLLVGLVLYWELKRAKS